ncbi:gamma-mobile-trio protein GmtX [Roseateles sp. BYS96W]|uniref:Gamma-mobile-trio protein GmtX n=1 Tax=Pelomonas nitida TaxID=3299027 RepID=A0ABW7GD00_9BURK
MSTVNHPESTLEQLLAQKPRPQKAKNLLAIHEVCRAQHAAGSRDLTVNAIGKLCEEQGILKARGLYNEPAKDYRALIEAWAVLAGPPVPKQDKKLATDEYVDRIPDPATRTLVRSVIAERNKLLAQLNTLKAATVIQVDRRPALAAATGGPTAASASLTESERDALKKAISPEFLESKAWVEVEWGEILDAGGWSLFDPGFATGLRKLLGES